jgi:hypothetical protein
LKGRKRLNLCIQCGVALRHTCELVFHLPTMSDPLNYQLFKLVKDKIQACDLNDDEKDVRIKRVELVFKTLAADFVASTKENSLFEVISKTDGSGTLGLIHYLVNDIVYIRDSIALKEPVVQRCGDAFSAPLVKHIETFGIEENNLKRVLQSALADLDQHDSHFALLSANVSAVNDGKFDKITILTEATQTYLKEMKVYAVDQSKPLAQLAVAFLPCALMYGRLREFYLDELPVRSGGTFDGSKFASDDRKTDNETVAQQWIRQQWCVWV